MNRNDFSVILSRHRDDDLIAAQKMTIKNIIPAVNIKIQDIAGRTPGSENVSSVRLQGPVNEGIFKKNEVLA